jgi:hypothetical protein
MASLSHLLYRRERGAALIIVLAFVVLLSGLVVAYLSRATSDRPVAQSSVHQTKVDQVALSGIDLILGGLRQEITNGSAASTVNGVAIYTPNSAANMRPVTFGNPDPAGIPNLVRRSVSGDEAAIPSPGFPSRGSALNSAPIDANNVKRGEITLARWNKHYLVPKLNTGDASTNPVASFVAPDWVILTRAPTDPNNPASPYPVAFSTWNSALADPTSTNNLYAVGRYAYAIYDEGSLLDANVVGYPNGFPTAAYAGRKGPVAFADLSVLPYPISNTASPWQVDRLVGWRNYGATQPTNNFPDTTFAANFRSGSAPALAYWTSIINRTAGFTTTSGAASPTNGRTDQMFLSRQQLIAYRATTQFSSNALQYLTTFSRELNSPSWKPTTPTATNPDLLTVRVTNAFTRFDGSSAAVGDPLIKQRFPLSRLAWITYKGPSATLQIGKDVDPTLKNPATSDAIILALVANGVSLSTLRAGTAANVKACFGLTFSVPPPGGGTVPTGATGAAWAGAPWIYTNPTGAAVATRILRLDEVAAASREPDFFELLKAGILSGSVGLGSGSDPAHTRTFVAAEGKYYDTTNNLSADYQIMQIGANIIDQWDPDSVPTFIDFFNTTGDYRISGIENLPYLNKLVFQPWWKTTTFEAWLIPSLWNPHQNAPAPPPPAATRNVRLLMTFSGSLTANSTAPTVTSSVTSSPQSMVFDPGGFGSPNAPTTVVTSQGNVTKDPTNTYYGFHFPAVTTTAPSSSTTGSPSFGTTSDFELQVEGWPAAGNWKTYQKWKGCANTALLKYQNSSATPLNNTGLQDPEFVTLDPRTVRFGVWGNAANQSLVATDYTSGVLTTLDQSVSPPTPPTTGVFEKITALPPQGTSFASSTSTDLYKYANNLLTETTVHYTDLDNVQREGDRVASGITAMQPADSVDRPQILNRPFQSLAELGQVFRDQPWKTLDFTTASSPDAGLLDVFTLHDSTNEGGKTSLNTKYKVILTAILSNAIKCLSGTCTSPIISSSQRDAIVDNGASGLFNITSANPMIRKTELLTNTLFNNNVNTTLGGNKEARELAMRAFSDATQTRTWNLMIDLFAQSGRYPPNASTLAGFLVEGEQHYWVHVAIDRFTGQVVDKQIEVVNE